MPVLSLCAAYEEVFFSDELLQAVKTSKNAKAASICFINFYFFTQIVVSGILLYYNYHHLQPVELNFLVRQK